VKFFSLILLLAITGLRAAAQTPDTTLIHELREITISGERPGLAPVTRLPDVYQTYLMAGKKTEVIFIRNLPANLAEKTGRQIFAKIPGVFVYDMDGSGNQVNIATRGLDAHRSWEYNIRQNGIMINSDIYGYPASHYTVPMEALERVELVRGTASLQYGAQFGGMINYVSKGADTSRVFSFESLNTAGSFGLFSTYNAIGGKVGKWTYYAYYQKRVSDGYRRNSRSEAEAQYGSLQYDFSPGLTLRAQLGHSRYLYQVPGPLTDSMFRADPRQATRSRNYFNPDIYVPSLTLDWKIGRNTTLNLVTSAVLGVRNSLLFDNFANVPDTINRATGQYAPRNVDIDRYNSYTTELRLLHYYSVGPFASTVSGGIRYIANDMHRQQRGWGTTGTDFDLTVADNQFGRDVHLRTQNVAFFVENLLYLTPRLKVSPGMRYEHGRTDMSGFISYLDEQDIPNTIFHRFPLFGINAEYTLKSAGRIYGGISQAYRPVLFKDIIPGSVLERANKDLQNGRGYNAELGVSGRWGSRLQYDVTLFQLGYNNRMGNLLMNENGSSYIYKTNIGNSLNRGLEMLIEAGLVHTRRSSLSVFTSTALMDARYVDATLLVGTENRTISGNRVESVPRLISRNGLQFGYGGFSAILQYSYVGETFADPLNTRVPSPTAAVGIVPAYGIWDLNTAVRFGRRFIVRAGINNLMNRQYFTKRPLFYPGPGVWSSDGRSIVVSAGIKI
jgi:Fe(3+) dicitrate transport protein